MRSLFRPAVLPLALLLLCGVSAGVNVANLADLQAALSDPTVSSVVLQSHINLATASDSFVLSNVGVAVTGDTAACVAGAGVLALDTSLQWTGGASPASFALCTLDMASAGWRHFTLVNASLSLTSVSLVGGAGISSSQPCAWGCGGGAVYADSTSVFATTSCDFSQNNMSGGGTGGAVYGTSLTAPLQLTSSSFSSNSAGGSSATGFGGAVGTLGDAVLDSCTFTANTAIGPNTGPGVGGAVSVGGSLTASNCSFVANSAGAGGSGGAINMQGNSLSIASTSFIGNTASQGGAVFSSVAFGGSGGVLIDGCTFESNIAISGLGCFNGCGFGGALFSIYGSVASVSLVSVSNSVFTSNTAANGGGALAGDSFVITGSAFASNTARGMTDFNAVAGGGGAIQTVGVATSSISLDSTSFTGNTAATFGGAVYAIFDPTTSPSTTPSVTIVDCAFASNAAPSGGALSISSAALFLSGNTSCVANTATTGSGGCIAASYAPNVSVSGAGVSFASNAAPLGSGGAAFLTSASLVSIAGAAFTNNSALHGGAVATDSGANVTSGVWAGNAASESGGAIHLFAPASASAPPPQLTVGGASFHRNTARSGAVFSQLAVASPGGPLRPASVLFLSSVTATDNTALLSGGLYFVNASGGAAAAALLPPCVGGCTFANAAPNQASATGLAAPAVGFAAFVASTFNASTFNATAYNALAPPALAPSRSRELVPPFEVRLWDVFGTPIDAWPDLVVSLSTNGTGLSGATTAAFASGAAVFDLLYLTDAVGAVYSLDFTLSSPTVGALDGRGGRVTASVAGCSAHEVFDAPSQQCVCAAGSAPQGGSPSCTLCPPGSFAANNGSSSCELCSTSHFAPGFGTTACFGCPAGSSSALGSVRLGDCACAFGYYMRGGACVACPAGAVCYGPGVPLALANYWHMPGDRGAFYACDAGACLPETAAGAAANASNCRPGQTGLVCGACEDGYAQQGAACKPCAAGDSFGSWNAARRAGLAAGLAVAFFAATAPLLLAPLFPAAVEAAKRRAARALSFGAKVVHTVKSAPRRSQASASVTPSTAGAELARRSQAAQEEADGQNALAGIISFLVFAQEPLNIVIDSAQIVASFQHTTRVAWPHIFSRVTSYITVLNFNILKLPKIACASPNPPFYTSFSYITLGVTGLLFYIGCVWAAGWGYAAHAGLPPHLVTTFHRTTAARLLALLNLCYAPVAQAVLTLFSCRTIGGGAWLSADVGTQCFTPLYDSYRAAAVFWLLVYPIGVPALSLALLYYYRIPQSANRLRRTAQLRQLVDLAYQRQLPLPVVVNTSTLTEASMSDDFVDALYSGIISNDARRRPDIAANLRQLSTRFATNMTPSLARLSSLPRSFSMSASMRGSAYAPPAEPESPMAADGSAAAPASGRGLKRQGSVIASIPLHEVDESSRPGSAEAAATAVAQNMDVAGGDAAPAAADGAAAAAAAAEPGEPFGSASGAPASASSLPPPPPLAPATSLPSSFGRLRASLSRFSVGGSDPAQPPKLSALLLATAAATAAEDAAAAEAAAAPAALPMHLTRAEKMEKLRFWARKRLHVAHYTWHDLQEEHDTRREGAEQAIGVLFEQFYPVRWYYVTFLSVFKLTLTSLLLFIAPGSASQIVAGMGIAFCALLLYSRMLPYWHKTVRRIAYSSYVVIFLFFFVALLLANGVRITSDDDVFYATVVGLLLLALVGVPFALIVSAGSVHASKVDNTAQERGAEAQARVAKASAAAARKGWAKGAVAPASPKV